MSKTAKDYQNKAIDRLLSRSKEILDDGKNKTIVFQSPTGSGKTFMMSQYISELIKEHEDKDLCFLWFSIGKGELHKQSYESLNSVFQGSPECCLLEDEFFGSRETITKNEVVIVNWEKLRAKNRETGEWKNILMKDKETVNFRDLIQNTQNDNKIVVLIIDESHSNATSERAIELRDEIVKPNLTIEMSATPPVLEADEKVIVESQSVIDAGMIKKEIVINENLDEIQDDEITSQKLILESAFLQREKLKKIFKAKEIDINPLVLVQIPTSDAGDDKKEFIEQYLSSKEITTNNQKLAIWLSDEKINQEKYEITSPNSEVDFLIFKQAIDTGWDCPRAQILVKFREIRSVTFEIQTVGRILRMPEAKHYTEDELNRGYVYTNLQSITIKRDTYNPNILKSLVSKRKSTYQNISLISYYRNRVDYGDITSSFYKVLEDTISDRFNLSQDNNFEQNKALLGKHIDLNVGSVGVDIISNHTIDSSKFEELIESTITSNDTINAKLSGNDMQALFETIIKENLHSFAPKRSIPTVKEGFYKWTRKYLNIEVNDAIYTQALVIYHAEIFAQILDKAILDYKDVKNNEVIKKIEETESLINNWEIIESRNYNPHSYDQKEYNKYIYCPSFVNFDSTIEKEFIADVLEKNENIEWWWQNGSEHMQSNFGIKYYKENDKTPYTFQPDFLVKLIDGRIGIFDTKAKNDRLDDQKVKSEALQKYIVEENKNGKNLFGGLVIKDGVHYKINQKLQYKSFSENQSDWEILEV